MPAKSKVKKVSTTKRKVVRSKPKINLLKHLNAILLITGFFASLFTVFALSSSDRNDIRSRGQALPSSAPSIAIPSNMPGVPSAVCLGGVCPSVAPVNPDEPVQDEDGANEGPGNGQDACDNTGPGNCGNRGNQEDDQEEDPNAPDDGANQDPDANNPDANPDNQDGDANKGHGNDEDGVDEDNPSQGKGGPNAEKNNPDQGGFLEQLIQQFQQMIQQLLQLFGGGAPAPVPDNNNQNNLPSPAVSTAPQVSTTP